MQRNIHGEDVCGVEIDAETRCAHWHSPLDIIAIKFKCCDRWYPCFDCHSAVADHQAEVWPEDQFSEKVVLCGACGYQLTVDEYLNCGYGCPACAAAFNPGCGNHLDLYFQVSG